MPRVCATDHSTKYLTSLVYDGHVTIIGATMGDVTTIFSSIDSKGKSTKAGLKFAAIARTVTVEDGGSGKMKFEATDGGAPTDVHLCLNKPCKSTSKALHLGEWAFLGVKEDPGDDPLLLAIQGYTRQLAEANSAAGLRQLAEATIDFNLGTPARGPPASRAATSEVGQWAVQASVPELGDLLTSAGLTSVSELAALVDDDVSALFATEPQVQVGSRARLRLALAKLRRDTGVAESPYLAPGPSLGPVPSGGGSLPPPGLARPAQPPAAQYAGNPVLGSAPVGDAAPGHFGVGGPLAEMARNARQLLGETPLGPSPITQAPWGPMASGLAGSPLSPPAPGWETPAANAAPHWFHPGGLPTGHGLASPPIATLTPGGQLLMTPAPRAGGRAVPLRIEKSHGAAVYEEWTGGGRTRVQDAVLNRTWKSEAHRTTAFDLARAVDVLAQSGLNPPDEPAGEVMLRSLAASWWVDKHPKDADVGDWMRESSIDMWGVPRGLLEEGRAMRKLTSAVGRSSANA